jgi:hypothetical protein
LIVSTIFTLFLVPAVLSLMFDMRAAVEGFVRRVTGHEATESVQGAD